MFAVRNHHLNVISEGWATSRAAATTIAPAVQHTAAWAGGTRVQLRRSTMDFSKRCDARDRRESEQHEQAATRHEFLYAGIRPPHISFPLLVQFSLFGFRPTPIYFSRGGPPGRIGKRDNRLHTTCVEFTVAFCTCLGDAAKPPTHPRLGTCPLRCGAVPFQMVSVALAALAIPWSPIATVRNAKTEVRSRWSDAHGS